MAVPDAAHRGHVRFQCVFIAQRPQFIDQSGVEHTVTSAHQHGGIDVGEHHLPAAADTPCKLNRKISRASGHVEGALAHVYGYAVGVDLTRRDLQNAAKDKGYPWDAAKGFDESAPISAIRRWNGPEPVGRIGLSVNGKSRQNAVVADMIWNVAEIVSEASKLWTLAPGDLIYTGTPEGVGPLVRGDLVEGEVEGVGKLAFRIV